MKLAAHAAATGGMVPERPRDIAKAKTIQYENPIIIPVPIL